MFYRFLRLLQTLRFLKGIQWRYQLYYRINNRFFTIHRYNKYTTHKLKAISLHLDTDWGPIQREYLGDNTFEFIGLKHSFGVRIDWNYQGNGKLWNYHLQYFSCLLDEDIPPEDRIRLLRDFSIHLLSSKIQPEPYPISLRIVNCLLFYSRYPISDPIILEAIQKQIDYLEHNIEYHILGNHLLENIFCLFISGIYINDPSLYQKSHRLLVEQLREQILDDGGHCECSVMYHSILLKKLLLCIDISRKVQWVTPLDLHILEESASKMLGWIATYSFPDGTWALMNDAAEGVAPTTENLFQAAKKLNIPFQKVTLSSSGYSKIKGEKWEILIKTGGVQPSYQPGHTHADIGSFCLWYKGQQIIVDRGISTYDTNSIRLEERGTQSHNTVSIAGLNQSDVWSSFRIGKRAEVLYKSSDKRIELVVSPFYNKNSTHERIFTKIDENKFSITDRVSTSISLPKFGAKGFLQFCKGYALQFHGNIWESENIRITFTDKLPTSQEKSRYSTHFNKFENGSRLIYHLNDVAEVTFEFL
jgi:hypothetical protein